MTTTMIIITAGAMTTTTTDPGHALPRLLAWLSPVFPVGSYSYSHGLEQAVHDGLVVDTGSLETWLGDLVECGSAWNDALLLAESWRLARESNDLAGVAALAEALAGGRERHLESLSQGSAFLEAAQSWPCAVLQRLPRPCAYAVAVGAVAAAHDIALTSTLTAFLQAFTLNQLQASIRLSVTGQSGVTALMARLEPVVLDTARRAAHATLDDLGSATFLGEVMAIRHETLHSRLFRS
ncbi:MAG: urease accessory protein UreF [Aquamicrobium sp.]|uniref:urease accessory protein UreF n=1 Tax=Mesorhizobium sp. Pch-S TaxID=2082387 RepID=UPI001013AE0D|nr:urease accessory protein UreF [Mesorhizobium sp. Pch-S]MBR2691265.1 urease accessory protein UreF [Aquamicrobium sp.]QAZ42227.1 urease accessory protein UreF [Mesorhizobium sp. Pch-S]